MINIGDRVIRTPKYVRNYFTYLEVRVVVSFDSDGDIIDDKGSFTPANWLIKVG